MCEIKAKKSYLSSYHNMLQRMEYLKRDIEVCKERELSVPGQDFTQPRVDHSPSYEAPFIKWILRRSDDEMELRKLDEKSKELKNEIAYYISKVGNLDYEMVLTYRYLDWMSWGEIGSKIYMSVATVRRVHDKAIEAFKPPDKNEQG